MEGKTAPEGPKKAHARRQSLWRFPNKDLRNYNTAGSGSPTWNDQISSMKIGAGITKVIVYWDVGPKGKSREFKRQSDNPDGCWSLTGDGWNDKISAIKIQ